MCINDTHGDRVVVPQSHCSIVSGLQHDHVVRLRAEPEQHLLVRPGRPDHIAGRFPEHLPDKNLGAVHRVHVGLRGHVQQGVESAQVAHESEEKRHQGKSLSESLHRFISQLDQYYSGCDYENFKKIVLVLYYDFIL